MTEEISTTINSPVTTIIVHRPKKNQAQAYEAWLKNIVPVAQQFPGHRGVNVIRPHGDNNDYTIIIHFDSVDNLRGWLGSDTRKGMVEEVMPLLDVEERIDINTGLEFWFTPQVGKKPAPAWKQFLITLSAIFPLTLIVPKFVSPFMEPSLLKSFAVSVIIVSLMVFVIMPRYVRLLSKWLYR